MAFYESKRVLILAIILALLVGAPLTALMLFLAIYSPASLLDPLILLCFVLAGPGMASLSIPPARRLLDHTPVLELDRTAITLHPRSFFGTRRAPITVPWAQIDTITHVRAPRGANYLQVNPHSGQASPRLNVQLLRTPSREMIEAITTHASTAGRTVTSADHHGVIVSTLTLTLSD